MHIVCWTTLTVEWTPLTQQPVLEQPRLWDEMARQAAALVLTISHYRKSQTCVDPVSQAGVTTVPMQSATGSRKCPRTLESQSPRETGRGRRKELLQSRLVMVYFNIFIFYHSSLWNHCIVGVGVNIHHVWTRGKSGGQEALEQTGTTEQGWPPSRGRWRGEGFLCVQWPTRIIIVSNFFVLWGIIFFFYFLIFFFLSKPNMLLISCTLYVCDSWGRGNWRIKDASSAKPLALRGLGVTAKRIHMITSPTGLFHLSFQFVFFTASSLIILFIVWVA